MKVRKRDGQLQEFEGEKIVQAIREAFRSTGKLVEELVLREIIEDIAEAATTDKPMLSVEVVQDLIEEELMQHRFYKEAKNYIPYRQKRTESRKVVQDLIRTLQEEGLYSILADIRQRYPDEGYDLRRLFMKFHSFLKEDMESNKRLHMLMKAGVELISKEAPRQEYTASRFLSYALYEEISARIQKLGLPVFSKKLKYLEEQGYCGDYIRKTYSDAKVDELGAYLKDERDYLSTYNGLELARKQYLICSHAHEVLEAPQEMLIGIAMHLALPEQDCMHWAKQIYDIPSQLRVTMTTLTMSNARKPYRRLSSCFIGTVEDTLNNIYESVDNFAQVSKCGGGMGLYFGKVRANGSDIRSSEGAAGGVIRWIKLVNDTTTAVGQLRVRQGAVAVHLDAWHKDLPGSLNPRTSNGNDHMKAHGMFPAVCYPDLFWKIAKRDLNTTWYLMYPHEIHKIKGYHLEDFYGERWEERYFDCVQDPRVPKHTMVLEDLVRPILKPTVETGTPLTFNHDHVNRINPNVCAGMTYCSNLCTETAQNIEALKLEESHIVGIDGESVVVNESKPGDFVACDLVGLSLGNIDVDNEEELSHIIHITVRVLDNVIDLDYYPISYAKITNRKYRPIGLGVGDYHHTLVKQNLRFESEEHLQCTDTLFEKINYYAIQAGTALAREKGSYSMFAGNGWQSGAYFTKRSYTPDTQSRLFRQVREQGIRNAQLMTIVPTNSTSIIAGTTAGVDPIMNKYYLEEKRSGMITRVAPDLDTRTFWLYRNARLADQGWVVRSAGIRQRHIGQVQSVNLYITNEFALRQVLILYIRAWEYGVKTIYYVRGKSLKVEECEFYVPQRGVRMGDLVRKPLFNEHGDYEVGKCRMINGSTANLNGLNNMKYTQVSDRYRQVMNSFWIPEEVNLNQDVKGYRRLRETGKTAYDETLSFLIFLDSIQTVNPPNVGECITTNEMNLCLTIQAFREAVRSQSYNYMLDPIRSSRERTGILYQWKDDERLLNRNKFIRDLYNNFQTRRDGRHLMRTMVTSYILESIYFYSGFMFLYSLGRMGKMPGSVQEIHYTNRGENTHLWLFRSIILELQKEEPRLFTEELIEEYKDILRHGVEEETRWGEYVVGNHIEGLTMEMISDYIHYLGNLRSNSLGFDSLYDDLKNEPESMEWVSMYTDANLIKTDFFEARSSAYTRSSALVDGLQAAIKTMFLLSFVF